GAGIEAGGANYEAISYEGYGPGGVAFLIECLTDNRNRAAAEVRTALTRNGGQLADPGSVTYVFDRRGVVIVPKSNGLTEDDLLEVVLDAGAEEVNDNGDTFEIVSDASDFVAIRSAVQSAGIDYESAEAAWVPNLQVPLDLEGARKMIRVIDALEDSDDVQNVYANGDIPDDVLAELDESLD
ncbi:MAG TPA: YebC/PmpR family DNA-binding transcriptional regulator, partial [Lapillicoccus sp.]